MSVPMGTWFPGCSGGLSTRTKHDASGKYGPSRRGPASRTPDASGMLGTWPPHETSAANEPVTEPRTRRKMRCLLTSVPHGPGAEEQPGQSDDSEPRGAAGAALGLAAAA